MSRICLKPHSGLNAAKVTVVPDGANTTHTKEESTSGQFHASWSHTTRKKWFVIDVTANQLHVREKGTRGRGDEGTQMERKVEGDEGKDDRGPDSSNLSASSTCRAFCPRETGRLCCPHQGASPPHHALCLGVPLQSHLVSGVNLFCIKESTDEHKEEGKTRGHEHRTKEQL
ncbi:unnamed protein product [Pleuronectes platessa]|uniref:Uncharacterized protein n=1 Tax=Pleuronectes platessa TaxID=8262 RepID=A0A9N7YT70_PLEPL|nr:unnamed protein product [Pleuronectes platessa]